jgi:cyclohexanecarboxylate-CoA ligase
MNKDAGAWLITDRLFETADRYPDRELIIDPRFGRFTYAEVARQVERLAWALSDRGLGSGDIVVLQLPNWTPFLVFHLALTAIGAVTVNIPTVFRQREVGGILELSGAKAVVVADNFRGFDFPAMAQGLATDLPDLLHVFIVESEGAGSVTVSASENNPAAMETYAELMSTSAATPRTRDDLLAMKPSLDDITALGFTSGTTGGLKGAVHDSRILAAINTGFIERYELNETDRIFGCSPFGHAVGFTHVVRMAVSVGASVVLLDYWDPNRALELIHTEGCTFMAGATPFLMDLVYHSELSKFQNLPSLRLFICGGTSVPEQLMRDAAEKLPATFVTPQWGMTECGGASACPFDAPQAKLFETDGLACGGMELKVIDTDGATVPPGVEGELMVRGPMVARGYYRLPELSKELFSADGFFRTGDQARMDEDGYIKITGRIKDLIIRGGVNIAPVDIESVLFAHPKIKNVAVVGVPDDRLGERVCAVIIPVTGKNLDIPELQDWLEKAGLAKQKWPERIETVAELPMTPSGKIQKFKLREMLDGDGK